MTTEPRATLTVADTIKSLRETFCVAQTAIGYAVGRDNVQARQHIDRLQRLVDDCDRQRPLDQAGKHGYGERCTATCGCEPPSGRGVADHPNTKENRP